MALFFLADFGEAFLCHVGIGAAFVAAGGDDKGDFGAIGGPFGEGGAGEEFGVVRMGEDAEDDADVFVIGLVWIGHGLGFVRCLLDGGRFTGKPVHRLHVDEVGEPPLRVDTADRSPVQILDVAGIFDN